jgi:hypothetical protein
VENQRSRFRGACVGELSLHRLERLNWKKGNSTSCFRQKNFVYSVSMEELASLLCVLAGSFPSNASVWAAL